MMRMTKPLCLLLMLLLLAGLTVLIGGCPPKSPPATGTAAMPPGHPPVGAAASAAGQPTAGPVTPATAGEAAAAAAPVPKKGDPVKKLKELDKDKDGKLTVQEMPAKGMRKALDTNHDNVVTVSEAQQAMKDLHGAKPMSKNDMHDWIVDGFKMADRNQDGKLTGKELSPEMLARLDANKDSAVTLEEMLAWGPGSKAHGSPSPHGAMPLKENAKGECPLPN